MSCLLQYVVCLNGHLTGLDIYDFQTYSQMCLATLEAWIAVCYMPLNGRFSSPAVMYTCHHACNPMGTPISGVE